MILEKRLIPFVLALRFLCVLCDDGALTSRRTTTSESTRSHYDSGSTRKIGTIHSNRSVYDSESIENNLVKIKDYPIHGFTDYYGSTFAPSSTIKLLAEDDARSSSSTTVDRATKFTTLPDDVTTTTTTTTTTTDSTNNVTICDPTWPVNASADTREVVNLRADEVSTEWIVLSWEPPCNATNLVIYSVERCDNDKNCNQANETDSWHNATGLEPCTQYTFRVKILTELWNSDGTGLSATTDHAISEIGDVASLNAHNVSVTAVQLTWQPPAIHAKCISNYSVVQCDGRSCNETVVNATSYTANDLKPCTKYRFTVKTVTPAVESAGVNQTAKTASPKLSAPQSLDVIPGNFSLTVKWEPPESGTVCLKHYRVTVDSNRYTVNTTNTSVMISHLYACKTYQVYINAVNEDDGDGDMIDKSGTTNHYKTNPPVLHTPGVPPDIHSLSMIWTIQKENNHCKLISIITMCNYTETKGKGYDPVNKVSPMKINSDTATDSIVVVNTTVDGLSAFTSYTCRAHVVNTGGYSDLSDEVNATTLEDVPLPPTSISVRNITDSQFSLSWIEPPYIPGYLEEFEIAIDWELLYWIPSWCPREEQNKDHFRKLNVSGSVFEYDYLEAEAFTKYEIRMSAKTRGGWGNSSEPEIFETNSGIPGAITKFDSSSIMIKKNPSNPNVLDTILTWGLPCSLNGYLEFFNISGHGVRDGYDPHHIFIKYECADYISNDYMCLINLCELKAEYNYTFTISTKVRDVDILGPEINQIVLYPAGIPPQPEDEYVTSITLDPNNARKSTTTATVLLPLFLNTNGNIKYYAIMVSRKGFNEKQSNTRFDLKKGIWPNETSWEEAMKSDFSLTYQATQPWWNPNPKYIADYGHMKVIEFTIGEDTICKDISEKIEKRVYCNGPLKPDTFYHVRIRAFTDGGYADSEIFVIKTNAELNVAVIIGAVFGILSLGILVTMMLFVRKCSPYIVIRRFLHSDMPGSPVPAPFTRKKFINHCQQLVDNPGKLSNEFRLLQTLSVDLQMPTNTACLQANRKKNRYSDILPYDFSRVKLDVIDNDPNTDYINASFIRGYTGEDEYIACQGPKEETTYDFWRMINQYNINIIVMLTQLVEKGKEKCHQYYPAISETFRYENMTIRCTSELDYRTHTQRTLVLQKENKKRNITHLHFKDWPDHDVPEDFDAMINFCQIMRRNISTNKGFIVVHCSAGIGRTGTLIAIDILLQQIRDNRKLDVFGTVYRLRHHRINMVQRESQYAYIYNCIKQVLKNPYFLKTYKPPPVEPIYENTSKKTKDTTNSDTNLVNNLEILKKHNAISMESLKSICNLSSWSTAESTENRDLRQCKSTSAINVKTHHTTAGKSRTFDCVFYKSLRDSSYRLNTENLPQDSLPLLVCSKSTDGDSIHYATTNM